jgi:inorganic pyrophosphatase
MFANVSVDFKIKYFGMTISSNIIILLLMFSSPLFAENIEYKEDGKYRIISNIHLINDVDYKKFDGYQILVEIPTGTRQKWEVNHKSGNLEWEFKNGAPRKVKFLGYPGNYGFIPQTLSGDGDALDIIVLSESAKRGDVLEVKVIGMLKFIDKGESDNKVIAISNEGVFKKIDTLKEMLLKEPNVIPIIRGWFEGYKGSGKLVFMGYENREKTISYIEKSHDNWKTQSKNK